MPANDIIPAYAVLPEAKVAEIRQLTPQAKVVFSMRHPIEWAWSFVQKEVGRNFEKCPDDLKAGDPQGECSGICTKKNCFSPPS